MVRVHFAARLCHVSAVAKATAYLWPPGRRRPKCPRRDGGGGRASGRRGRPNPNRKTRALPPRFWDHWSAQRVVARAVKSKINSIHM